MLPRVNSTDFVAPEPRLARLLSFDRNVPLTVSNFFTAAVEKHNNTGHVEAGGGTGTPLSSAVGGWVCVRVGGPWEGAHGEVLASCCLRAPSTPGEERLTCVRVCV